MSDISPINTSTSHPAGRVERTSRISADPSIAASQRADDVRGRGGARPNDRVELSQVAKYLSQLQAQPTQSAELIHRVRAEIDSGTYLTDDKLSIVAQEIASDIL